MERFEVDRIVHPEIPLHRHPFGSRSRVKLPEPIVRRRAVDPAGRDAYKRRLNGEGPDPRRPRPVVDHAEMRAQFEKETGLTPEQWIARWKGDQLEDTPENMARLVRALGLRGDAKVNVIEGEQPAWALAALAALADMPAKGM